MWTGTPPLHICRGCISQHGYYWRHGAKCCILNPAYTYVNSYVKDHAHSLIAYAEALQYQIHKLEHSQSGEDL